jgi:hypothetical protein
MFNRCFLESGGVWVIGRKRLDFYRRLLAYTIPSPKGILAVF